MRGLRIAARLICLLVTTLTLIPAHLVARRDGLSIWSSRFLARCTRCAGFDLEIRGTPRLHDVFFVANHLSWIDIFALGGATGCAFISKDEIARLPLIGWLGSLNNTIYVAREKRGEVSRQIEELRKAIKRHQPVALFPEGITGDGKALKPFKPALFSVLLPPPRDIMIQPVVIDYGPETQLIAWPEGSNGQENMLRVLGLPGRRTVTLHFLEPFHPAEHIDRKALAAECRARILNR